MNEFFAGKLYFALQRARHGVDRDQVKSAQRILDSEWSGVRDYVLRQLAELHGPKAAQPEWLARQPLVDRAELIPRMSKLLGDSGSAKVEWRKTSGSTGTPFRFAKDVRMTAWMDATMWAVYAWHGVQPGDRQARFWGAPLTSAAAAKRATLDGLQNRRRLSAFQINADTGAAYLRKLARFRPAYAYGYPTLIDEFVTHCSSQGMDGRHLRLRVVICTGELLSPAVRHRIGEFFACPVANEYGCSESGVLAIECEKGTMHVTPVAAFPEVVSPDGRETELGNAGEVVVSDLYGRVDPFVRYRVHDHAVLDAPASCGCGRELPALSVQQGRIDSFITTPHRGRVYDAVLAYTVPPEVFRFRARQVASDLLEVDVVPGPGYDPLRTPDECQRVWQAALGPGMHVTVKAVSDIPLTSSGKLRYFVPLGVSGPPPPAPIAEPTPADASRPEMRRGGNA